MIFFIGNTGTVTYSFPTPVYQGSDDANNIYVVAPFAQNLTATAAFTLPNGVNTEPYNLTYKGEISGIQGADGKPLYGWQMSIPNDLTQYYGTVLVQFSFYSSAGTINTAAGSFTVGRGVAAALPATPSADVYGQILSLIATLQQDLGNSYYSAKALRSFPVSGATYEDGDVVFVTEGGSYFLAQYGNGELTPIFNFTGVNNEIENVINEVNAAKAAAQAAAAQASESATSAQNAQTAAEGSETAAQNSAQAAQDSATAAEGAQTAAENAQTAAQEAKTAAQNSAESAQAAANSAAEIENYVDNFQQQIDGIYNVLNATVTNQLTVSDKYTSRQTADGTEIIDGSLTRVQSIQGDTVATADGLKSAFFSSITSSGRNLLKYTPNLGSTSNGITYRVEDGIIYADGTNTGSEYAFMTILNGDDHYKLPAGQYTQERHIFSGQGVPLFAIADNTTSQVLRSGNGSFTLSERKEVRAYFTVHAGNSVTNIVFSEMLNWGDTALPYEPYTEDVLSVSTPIELTKYDTAYPAENKIVRYGATLTQETPFTEEQLAQYGEYVLSQDGMTIVYKKDEPTEETVVFNKFFYTVYNNGMETIEQGATDNSEYGAECTVTQIYVQQKGGTQS